MPQPSIVSTSEQPFWKRLRQTYHAFCPRIVITKSFFGLKCRTNINDHLFFILLKPEESIEIDCYEIMKQQWGDVWDIGSNFGFYSLASAKAGNRTTAFDLSPYVLKLLDQSCKINNLSVTTVPKAISVETITYNPPATGSCKNSLADNPGDVESMTYLQAEAAYGTPSLIKMDIEGAERMFFESEAFMAWLKNNSISLLVELHDYKPELDRIDCPSKTMVDSSHVFLDYRADAKGD